MIVFCVEMIHNKCQTRKQRAIIAHDLLICMCYGPTAWRSPSPYWTVIYSYMVEATRPWTASTWPRSQTLSSSRSLASPESSFCIWLNYSERWVRVCVCVCVCSSSVLNNLIQRVIHFNVFLCVRPSVDAHSGPEPSVRRSRCWLPWASTHLARSRHLWAIPSGSARRRCPDACLTWPEPWWRKLPSSSHSTGVMPCWIT